MKPRIHYDAPIVPIDLAAFHDGGTAYEITACNDCLPWRAEVIRDDEDPDMIGVREWHAIDCATLAGILRSLEGS